MKTNFSAIFALLGACFLVSTFEMPAAEAVSTSAAAPGSSAKGTPVIQFETTFFDFGRITALGKVSGSFKFKNAGDGVLKLEPPKPSCGCTDAKATPDTLAPGQSGVITYTINLDHPTGQVQKTISIYSNDPKTPDVELTMQLDCTPLYEVNPKVLRIVLPPNKDEAQGIAMVTRNDGLPAEVDRLISSQPLVNAAVDASAKTDANVDRIKVTVHRPAKPTPKIMANIQLWANGETNHPLETLTAWCEIEGELSVSPAKIYWVIPNLGNSITNYPAESLTHVMKLTSVLDQPVKIKSVNTNIKGLNVQTVDKDGGKAFDLVLKFDELPHQFTTGTVTVETSSDTLPKLEVPVTVAAAQ